VVFDPPLIEGILIKRYKRFLADVQLGDTVVTGHCTNTGSMITLIDPGVRVWISEKKVPQKLKYTFEMVENDGNLVGVNTSIPPKLVRASIEAKYIESLSMYSSIRAEVKYGLENSRIDFLLEGEGLPPCFIEVKQVHLKRGKNAVFPDAVTDRGAKHLRELMNEVDKGNRAVMFYVVQRADVEAFELASDIDPVYAKTAALAKQKGVEFIIYTTDVSVNKIQLSKPLPFVG
jgi:sugar fermentation stimulation protein A